MTTVMNRRKIILPALLIFIIFSCREIYYPEVDGIDNMLIVDGLITDQAGMNVIKLKYYLEKTGSLVSLSNASVNVSDDLGNITPFRDNDRLKPGQYFPPSGFAGITGRSYTLHIAAPDGSEYQSTAQTIIESARIDSVYPKHAVKQFVNIDHYGVYSRETLQGFEAYSDLSGNPGKVLRFRIEPSLILLYAFTEIIDTVVPPVTNVHYRWKKARLTDAPEINIFRFGSAGDNVKDHMVSFFPSGKAIYKLEPDEFIHRMIIVLRYYTLNPDAYNFHYAVHKQVNSENKLFDPIASQLPSNISCINTPGKLAAGFFEVSSSRSETYMLLNMPHIQLFKFVEVQDMEHIPARGSVMNEKPDFWQD
jgi:hypothetical protein